MILFNFFIVKSLLYTICVLNAKTILLKTQIKIWTWSKEANTIGLIRTKKNKVNVK